MEEHFYLDDGQIKITAASVGISKKRWTCINEEDIANENFKILMSNNRFDILPIIADDGTVKEFFKTNTQGNYNDVTRQTITYQGVLVLDTPIHEVIKNFATENRSFYFLTFQNRITGLIAMGNLNCRQVQVYIFALICELERRLGEFINSYINKEHLEIFIKEKSITNKKFNDVWLNYNELIKANLENSLIEHLYLIDFFSIIENFGEYLKLGYSKKQWKELSSINDLRHLVAHPTRSLLDKDNSIERLWKRINRIEDLTFRIKQWK